MVNVEVVPASVNSDALPTDIRELKQALAHYRNTVRPERAYNLRGRHAERAAVRHRAAYTALINALRALGLEALIDARSTDATADHAARWLQGEHALEQRRARAAGKVVAA